MLVHIPGSSHPLIRVRLAIPIASMNFFATVACTAYVAIPITTWDEEFRCWDHCSQGPKWVVEWIFYRITDTTLCSIDRYKTTHSLTDYNLQQDDQVETVHIKKSYTVSTNNSYVYTFFQQSYSYRTKICIKILFLDICLFV